MAYSKEIREEVKRFYVMDRLSLEAAAARVGVSISAAKSWKKKALDRGDNWDRAREASRMASGNLGDLTTQVLEDFALLFQSTVDQLREDTNMTPMQKAEALSRMSDAYAKTMRAATKGSPELGRLAIALEVIDRLAQHVQSKHPSLAPSLLTVIESFGAEISRVYG